MARTPVALNVGGQAYRIVANVPEDSLKRLASVVDARIRELVPPGKPVPPTAILLAAIALANDLEEERTKRQGLEARSRDVLRRLLTRIDDALEAPDASETVDGYDHDPSDGTPAPPSLL
jgi:cell division protein ZapA